jgi:purine-nucleoside phosphorylase
MLRLGKIATDHLGDYRMRRGDSAREIDRLVSENREKVGGKVDVGVICGSGLIGITDILKDRRTIPEQGVQSLASFGNFCRLPTLHAGTVSRSRIAIFEKRFHIYEGCSAWESTLPVRMLAGLGARIIVLTCSTGSLRRSLVPGSILLIRDHINLSFRNPGRGMRFGPSKRFVELIEPYAERLAQLAWNVAIEMGISLPEGVLVSVSGPSYETRAEARMLRTLGGDVVSMSMVPEVIVSRMFGLEVLGLTAVTNLVPMNGMVSPITHGEVLSSGQEIVKPMSSLIDGVIRRLETEGTCSGSKG